MKKPRKGNAREVFDILDEHGPMAYYAIRRHLVERGSEQKPKQTKIAVNNLMGRRYIQRCESDYRRYEIRAKRPDFQLEMPEPVQTPSPVEKTPEREEIRPTEGLFGLNMRDSAIVIAIAIATSALTTIILRIL